MKFWFAIRKLVELVALLGLAVSLCGAVATPFVGPFGLAIVGIGIGIAAGTLVPMLGIDVLLVLGEIRDQLERAENRELEAIAAAQPKKVEIPDPDAPPKGLPLLPAKFGTPPVEKPGPPPQRKSTARPQ